EMFARRGITPPQVVGHEFAGVVEDIGAGITHLKRGDRVVASFRSACGRCEVCRRGEPAVCPRGATFGVDQQGAQAEYIRVPLAETTLEPIPAGLEDEQVIFVGDIFSTGYMAADNGKIQTGDTVAVFGCGPVGLFAQLSAQFFGPAVVYAVDRVPERLERARKLGSIPINADEVDPVQAILERTDGRGVDVALEAVGAEATLLGAINAVRPYGRVSSIGVFAEDSFPFPVGQAFGRGLHLSMGRCHVQRYMPRLIRMIEHGRVDLRRFVSHTIPLAEAPEGFKIFDRREAFKILLKP
ncbi:MAG: alcohol dehydrogenase catalytic domain-containing protein, partial [Chloroflexi bacterium]|nr:alcohol dehydrogenase catalytic domain-containing protein [Chloroflexota bacterium]